MAIKRYKPTTPGRRGMTVTDYSGLSKVAPEKSLLEPVKKHSGRNNTGRITVRHQGGGNRRKYRVIDFKRDKLDMPATVLTLEYDPNRSAHIALVQYEDGEKRYIHGARWSEGRRHCCFRSPMQTSSPATRCPWRTSPSVPSSTMWSCTPARAPSWPAPPASWPS